MKKILSFLLACAAVLTLASCGSNKSDDPKPVTPQDPGKGQYPRVTYYDGKEGYKYAAALQNAHLIYNYGEDHNDGNGVVSYPFEFLNCEDYHYHCRYTLVGYDEARKGELNEPDDHVAIVYDDGKYVLYDFYRKLIVDDFPLTVIYEEKTFLPENLGSATFPILRQTRDFEKGTKSTVAIDTYCERVDLAVTSSLCPNAKGCELKTRIVTHGKTDHESQYTNYKFYYDPETEIGLYCEFYLTDDPKIQIDGGSEEAYYVYSSELMSRVEVTTYEIGKVSPSTVTAKVSEIMNGHESEYTHISYSDYGDIFA